MASYSILSHRTRRRVIVLDFQVTVSGSIPSRFAKPSEQTFQTMHEQAMLKSLIYPSPTIDTSTRLFDLVPRTDRVVCLKSS